MGSLQAATRGSGECPKRRKRDFPRCRLPSCSKKVVTMNHNAIIFSLSLAHEESTIKPNVVMPGCAVLCTVVKCAYNIILNLFFFALPPAPNTTSAELCTTSEMVVSSSLLRPSRRCRRCPIQDSPFFHSSIDCNHF